MGVTSTYVSLVEQGKKDPSGMFANLVELMLARAMGRSEETASGAHVLAPGKTPRQARPRMEDVTLAPVISGREFAIFDGLPSRKERERMAIAWQPTLCPDQEAFAIRVECKGMDPRFPIGSTVVVMTDRAPVIQQPTLVKTRDGALMLRYFAALETGRVRLVAENPSFGSVEIETERILANFPAWTVTESVCMLY